MRWLSLRAGSSWLPGPQMAGCSSGTSATDSWSESLKATRTLSTPWSLAGRERSSPQVGDSLWNSTSGFKHNPIAFSISAWSPRLSSRFHGQHGASLGCHQSLWRLRDWWFHSSHWTHSSTGQLAGAAAGHLHIQIHPGHTSPLHPQEPAAGCRGLQSLTLNWSEESP